MSFKEVLSLGFIRYLKLGTFSIILYTSFSSLSSSCVNSLRIPMRIKKKIRFVKVCYNWFMRLSVSYNQDTVNKIPVGATEKLCMKSI